jgi:hypothetical protein
MSGKQLRPSSAEDESLAILEDEHEQRLYDEYLAAVKAYYDDQLRSRLGQLRTGRAGSGFHDGIHLASYLWGRVTAIESLMPELSALQTFRKDVTNAAHTEAYARFLREVKNG